MMNKKIAAVYFMLISICALCGCQLAKPDSLTTTGDRLIGVFVTTEYLDLFDMEGYLNNHISDLADGNVIDITNSSDYQGRIYATLQSEIYTSEDTGEKIESMNYVFEDLEGISFFEAQYNDSNGETFYGNSVNDAVNDIHLTISDNSSLEGTIYTKDGLTNILYVNPVYQSGDGRVYATSGNSYSASGNNAEGTIFSTTLEERQTTTVNGETKETSFQVILHITVKYPPESIHIVQMNSDHTAVTKDTYKPGTLPKILLLIRIPIILLLKHTPNHSKARLSNGKLWSQTMNIS